MDARARAARSFYWRATADYWNETDQVLRLGHGTLARSTVTADDSGERTLSDAAFLDRLLELADLRVSDRSRTALLRYSSSRSVGERIELLYALSLAPELHLA